MRCCSGSDFSARTRSRISKCSIWSGAGQARLALVPTHCGALTCSAVDLTDIFVVEDPEEPRSQIRSHLPEVKLSERSRQALLDEVVGVDRIMRQIARISKVGKYALDLPMQHGLRVSRSSSELSGSPGAAVSTISQPAVSRYCSLHSPKLARGSMSSSCDGIRRSAWLAMRTCE